MTPEEKEEIINAAVERAMLMLPETVGHLITNHMTMVKLNEEFYQKNPEFKNNKDIVASIMEVVEGENPLGSYQDLLDKAVPRIRERMQMVKGVDKTTVDPKANRDFSSCGDI